ncbi:MAG: diguanylate cyclase, partial [Acidimicrobiales bacterium]
MSRLRRAESARGIFIVMTAVAVLGLLVTAAVAWSIRSSADASVAGRFDEQADEVLTSVRAEIDNHLLRFSDIRAFVAATYPGSFEEFTAYMQRVEFGDRFPAFDRSAAVVERVAPDAIAALEAREHKLGSPDFRVWAMTDPPGPGEDWLVVTRTNDFGSAGIDFLGVEISPVRDLFEVEFPEEGIELMRAGPGSAFVPVLSTPELSALVDLDEVSGASVGFIGPVSDESGRTIAWVLQPGNLAGLVTGIAADDVGAVNVTIRLEKTDEPVAVVVGDPDIGVSPRLTRVESFESGSLRWDVEIVAGDRFATGVSSGGTGVVWVVGSVVTALVASLLAARMSHGRRLRAAAFEVELARTLAQTDGLTGLRNRPGLATAVSELSTRAGATLFFVDLDGFKAVNDERGHDAGDEVLRAVARALSDAVRDGDLVIRIGGDEFVVLAPGLLRPEQVEQAAERLREAVAAVEGGVSASIGVAGSPAGRLIDVEGLLRAADVSMYEA